MLNLSGRYIPIRSLDSSRETRILRVCTEKAATSINRHSAFLVRGGQPPPGYSVYLLNPGFNGRFNGYPNSIVAELSPDLVQLEDGDVVRLTKKDNRIRVLYRRHSPHNTFLVTERCDNYCLMCSQPPKNINDDWIIEEILEALPLLSLETEELGFTGGEPTLLGDSFIEVLRVAKEVLPRTAIHVLSNGRRFSDPKFSKKWAEVNHPDIMVGIPVYSDISSTHDCNDPLISCTGHTSERNIL